MNKKNVIRPGKTSLNRKLVSRRRFLKYSFWGTTAAVASTATIQYLNQVKQQPDATNNFSLFRPMDVIILQALIPVILAGALPVSKAKQVQSIDILIHNLETALNNFSPANRQQIMQLFDLLSMPITRILAAGIWSRWEKTPPERIDQFLFNWRNSRIGQLNLAYNALAQLIPSIWYGSSENWASIGYAGPPKIT